MKKRVILVSAMMAGAITAQAGVMLFEDFDGNLLPYADNGVASWVSWLDYANFNTNDMYTVASEAEAETVLAALPTSNDVQVRNYYSAGFGLPANAITNISIRYRCDQNLDGIYNDTVPTLQLRWGPTAGGTLVAWDTTTTNEINGWLTATAAFTNGLGGGQFNAVRIDPVSGIGKMWELDYFKIEGTSDILYEVPPIPSTNTVITWEFNTDGDVEGWDADTNQVDSLTTVGGVLTSSGILGSDPKIERGDLYVAPSGENWFKAEFRARQLDTNGVAQAWDGAGTTMVIDGTVFNGGTWDITEETSGEWIVAKVDLSRFSSNMLSGLRFDPIGGTEATNKNFEVDYFRLLTTPLTPPEPTELLLVDTWEFNSPGDTNGMALKQITNLVVAAVADGDEFVLNGKTTGNDPGVTITNKTVVSADGWDTMEIRARQLSALGTPMAWASQGTIALVNNVNLKGMPGTFSTITNEANGQWITASYDISTISGNITQLRLDPIGGATRVGMSFEIDYIKFYSPLVPGYEQFVYENILLGEDALESADPDLDEASNFQEYAFGGDPNNPFNVGVPAELQGMVDVGGTNMLTYVYYRLASATSGVDYSLVGSENLEIGPWADLTAYSESVGSYSSSMDAVTNLVPIVENKQFIRTKAVGQ